MIYYNVHSIISWIKQIKDSTHFEAEKWACQYLLDFLKILNKTSSVFTFGNSITSILQKKTA